MANNKKILVIQPQGLNRESILILIHGYSPDIADTIDDAIQHLHANPSRYDIIFLGGFPMADMENMIRTIEAHPVHGTTDIVACVESMYAWKTLQSPLLSITKQGKNGWNIGTTLGSILPAKFLV